MHAFPVPVLPGLPTQPRTRQRTALVASADRSFRQRLTQILTGPALAGSRGVGRRRSMGGGRSVAS